jgi:hypothetical protein
MTQKIVIGAENKEAFLGRCRSHPKGNEENRTIKFPNWRRCFLMSLMNITCRFAANGESVRVLEKTLWMNLWFQYEKVQRC